MDIIILLLIRLAELCKIKIFCSPKDSRERWHQGLVGWTWRVYFGWTRFGRNEGGPTYTLKPSLLGFLGPPLYFDEVFIGRDNVTAIKPKTLSDKLTCEWKMLYLNSNFTAIAPGGPSYDNPVLVWIMDWYRKGDQSLSEQIMALFTNAYMCHSLSMNWGFWLLSNLF